MTYSCKWICEIQISFAWRRRYSDDQKGSVHVHAMRAFGPAAGSAKISPGRTDKVKTLSKFIANLYPTFQADDAVGDRQLWRIFFFIQAWMRP